jgi:hypothetical protein
MKNLEKLLTQTRRGFLLCVLSLLGITCSFSYDIASIFVSKEQLGEWWGMRITVLKCGYIFFLFALKTFEGYPKMNVLFNVGIGIILSDLIGRLTGDKDRDVWDFIWCGIIIIFSIYEYWKRNTRIS